MSEIYSNLNLIISDLYVILQPDAAHSQKYTQPLKSIFIDRNTLQIEGRTSDSSPILSGSLKSCTKIFGCLGIINLLAGPYLIYIAEFEKVGFIRDGQNINKVTKANIIPLSNSPSIKPLNEEEKKEEKNYLSYLNDLLATFDFYYSYNFDITQSEQRVSKYEMEIKKQQEELKEVEILPIWKRADNRFFWNYNIQKPFIEHGGLDNFILPVMDGFIKISEFEINTIPFKYALISRRSCKRTGARYHTRGVDPLGNVANFVETEQVIVFDKVLTSFVQVRGSIPIIWQQKGKGLKPKPMVENSTQTDEAFKLHMNELIDLYGPEAIVNLIDQIGSEASIGDQFEMETSLFEQANQCNYTAFDFHEKCKNNKYENLQELLNTVKPLLDKFGYLFKSVLPGEPSLIQKGAFRTNCVDCLDRTNVVQSLFARYILFTQLTKMGILSTDQKIENNHSFETEFKNIWADNADVMSEQYTGTVALKTDYTRTGKRSVKGTMTDGMNSVRRYINKNFKDDERQAAVDLFLGKFQVERFVTNNANNNNPINNSNAAESVNEFNVEHILTDQDLKGEAGILKVTEDSIISWVKYNGKKKVYNFKSPTDIDIILIEKSKLNHKILNLYHKENPLPEKFLFTSPFVREQFLQLLYKKPLSFKFLPILESEGKEYINYLEKLKEVNINSLTTDFITTSDDEDNENINNNNDDDSNIKFSPTNTMKHKLIDMFNSFIGSWNMENITLNSTFVANWIPKDKDFYSISAQRIASYKPSPGFVMNYKQYWFYLVRQYLGNDYITLATASTDNTASIVLIKKSLATSVNNVSVSYIQKRVPFKRSSLANATSNTNAHIVQEINTSSLSTNSTLQINSKEITTATSLTTSSGSNTYNTNSINSTSSSSSTSSGSLVSNLYSSIFSSKKLKDYSNKIMGTSNQTTELLGFGNQKNKDANTLYGTTITLQLRDTSICFVNYCNNTPTTTFSNTPNSIDDESGLISYIKNKQYLNGSTRYTFWSGDFDSITLSKQNWIASNDSTSLNDEEPGRGIIYWKSLIDSEPLLESIDNNNIDSNKNNNNDDNNSQGSPTGSNVYIYQPLAFNYSLPVLSPFSWLSIQDIPCFIIIKSLYCEPFELIPSGTKLEAFMEFNAYHLICDDNSSYRTSTIRSNIPVWNDKLELKSYIDDKEYLKTQYIQVGIFNRELMDQSVIGKGSIPLKHASGDKPYHFKIPLTLQDEFSCFLHGEIQIFTKSEIHQYLLQQQPTTEPPSVPSRQNRASFVAPNRTAPLPPSSNSNSNTSSPNSKSPNLTFKNLPIFQNDISNTPKSNSNEQLLPQTVNNPNTPNTPTKSTFLENLTKSVVDNLKGSGEFLLNSLSTNTNSTNNENGNENENIENTGNIENTENTENTESTKNNENENENIENTGNTENTEDNINMK